MNSTLKALQAACLLAALTLFSALGYAADPATPQGNSPSAAAAEPASPTVTPKPETPLHEIGGNEPTPAPAAAPAPAATAAPVSQDKPSSRNSPHMNGEDMVAVMGSVAVLADEHCIGNAVSVMGPVTVDGIVDGNAVAVMGRNEITGTVHGNAVAVMGVLKLGPNAHVDGNAVCVGGVVDRAPGAYVGGNVVSQARGLNFEDNSAAYSWWHHGLRLGRPLAFGPNLHVLWIINFVLIAFYALLALAFPNGVTKCGDTLTHRPGITFLTGILAILGLPVLFILLLVTVVGIPVALVVLPLAVLAAVMFGKSEVYALIGRSVLGKPTNAALAVLAGALIMVVFYFIPFLGLAIWSLVAFLSFACAVTTLFSSTKQTQPAVAAAPGAPLAAAPAVPPAAPVALAVPLVVAAAYPESVSGQPQPPAAEAVPPVVPPVIAAAAAAPVPPTYTPAAAAVAASAAQLSSEVSLPRAGFWVRMVALLVDVILIGAVTHMHNGMNDVFLPAIAAYGAVLWKFRGATIGDIIFGLKVVRADAKPLDWMTAIVRALACFLSLIAVGLGFFWIAFCPEKQGWHDKIAGTIVVKLPKGTSLV